MLVKRQGRVVNGGAEGALLLQLPLLLLAHCVGLFAVHDTLGQDGHLGWLQLLRYLSGDMIFLRFMICATEHIELKEQVCNLQSLISADCSIEWWCLALGSHSVSSYKPLNC